MTYRRVNVNSGRQLEQLAHYSRALRVGDTVLQSGTTAIDLEGNVIGEGDVAKQVDTIIDIAETAMGKAGGRLEDVVRSRESMSRISGSRTPPPAPWPITSATTRRPPPWWRSIGWRVPLS